MMVCRRIIRNFRDVYSIFFTRVKSSYCRTQGRYWKRKWEKQLIKLDPKCLRTLIKWSWSWRIQNWATQWDQIRALIIWIMLETNILGIIREKEAETLVQDQEPLKPKLIAISLTCWRIKSSWKLVKRLMSPPTLWLKILQMNLSLFKIKKMIDVINPDSNLIKYTTEQIKKWFRV